MDITSRQNTKLVPFMKRYKSSIRLIFNNIDT
jgi:hypothetical protein